MKAITRMAACEYDSTKIKKNNINAFQMELCTTYIRRNKGSQ